MGRIKTTKYLKYAIGEIILVVVGILIALGINNWNEARKFKQTELTFLEGIKEDLKADKNYIKDVLAEIHPKITVFETLNYNSSNDVLFEQDTLTDLLKIYLFRGQRTFYPVSGAFQSALSENQLNAFENKDLVREIIKLYQSTYSRLIDNANILDIRWADLSKAYTHERRTERFGTVDKKMLSKVLDDVYFHYIQLKWYRDLLKNTDLELEDLINKLELEV